MKAAFLARLVRIGRFCVMLGCTLLTALLLLLGSVRRYRGTLPIYLRAAWDDEFTLPQAYWQLCDEVYYYPHSASGGDGYPEHSVRFYFVRDGRKVDVVAYELGDMMRYSEIDLDVSAVAQEILWNDGEYTLSVWAFPADTLFSVRYDQFGDIVLTAIPQN